MISPEVFGDWKPGKKDDPYQICICCPFCEKRIGRPDTKYHLYIHLKKGVWHCFRCEAKGKLSTLLEYLGIGEDRIPSLEELKERINKLLNYDVSHYVKDFDVSGKIEKFDIFKHRRQLEYLLKVRRFPWHFIQKKLPDLYVGLEYEENGVVRTLIKDRIVFPVRDLEGNIVAINARSIDNRSPKYITLGSKSQGLYGSLAKEIILCEGVFSAWRAELVTGIPAVAILGKHLSNQQLRMIWEYGVEVVNISLDADVSRKEIYDIYSRLFIRGMSVYVVKLEEGDPDEAGERYKEYFEARSPIPF